MKGKGVWIGKINCNENKITKKRFDIESCPVLKFFKKGEKEEGKSE